MASKSVFDHRRSLLQSYAKAHLDVRFPQIGNFMEQIRQFKKPDQRKNGKFCLICFITEIDKHQIVSADIDSMTSEQSDDHVRKILAAITKFHWKRTLGNQQVDFTDYIWTIPQPFSEGLPT